MVWANHKPVVISTKNCGVALLLCCLCLIFFTPTNPHSPHYHHFSDMRNFFGVPNTLNVMTNFPFLVVGVLGFVFCLHGNTFTLSFKGEVFSWGLFYCGIAGVAFGSAYYHLKPDDSRLVWDALPMMIAWSSLLSCFLVERVGMRIGLACLFFLILLSLLCIFYERTFNDLRLCVLFQFIPLLIIVVMAFFYSPKYTHSRYWLWAAGVFLLAKLEAIADMRIYRANNYIISGHSLGHLFLVAVPILFGLMLMFRSVKFRRLGDVKDSP